MIKSVVRTALVATLIVGVIAFAQTVRADDAPATPVAPAAPAKSMARGVVESVDPAAKTVTITHKKETSVFTLAPDAVITGENKQAITLADLKKGDHIVVHYTEVGTSFTATSISFAQKKPAAPAN